MNRRKLLGLVCTAPFAAPALTDAMAVSNAAQKGAPHFLKKSTWADKKHQTIVSNYLNVNMFNAGMPQTHVHVGFPHTRSIKPMLHVDISVDSIGLGSEYAKEIPGDFDPAAFLDEMKRQLEPDDDEQFKRLFESAKAMQAKFDSMRGTHFADPVTVGTAAAIAGVIVGVAAVGLAALAFGYQVGKDIWNQKDSDGDGVRNGMDKYPHDPNRSFMATEGDANQNGIPDELEGPLDVYLRDSVGSAHYFPEGSEAFISFTAQDDALLVDTAITTGGESQSLRIVLNA